jgi:uncharacterized protein YggT (Ycf19 family)
MASKYTKYQYQQVKVRRWDVHPYWRGAGLFFIIMIPLMSFLGAISITRQNFQAKWFQVPAELLRWVDTPALKIFSQDLGRIYYMDIALTILFIVLGFGLMTVFYSILWRYIGPSRYGPVDSPPIRTSPHKRTR